MAFLVKALFSWNEYSKNAGIIILSNFLAIFPMFFSTSRNFAKYYLHAKFHINWTIQTDITEGGGGERGSSDLPRPYKSAKSLAYLGLKLPFQAS